MASVGVIPSLFVGEADACERMVAGLQYCSFLPLHNTSTTSPAITQYMRPMTIQQITGLVEKGILYREMIDLRELTLLDQAFYITQKFTEFGERLEIIDADVKVKKLSAELIVTATVNKAREIHDFHFSKTKLLKVFQIIQLQDFYLLFHQNNVNPLESVCLVICSDVIVINFSWGNIDALVDALEECLLPLLHTAPSYDMNLICIIRGHATLGDSVSKLANFHERDESDEQMLVFHEFLQTLQFEERTKSINTLKAALSGVDHSLMDNDRSALLSFLETGKIPYEEEEPRPVSSQLILALERAQQQKWDEQEDDADEVDPVTHIHHHDLEPLPEGGEGEEEPSPTPLPAPASPIRAVEARPLSAKPPTPLLASPDAKAGPSSRPSSTYKMLSPEDKFEEKQLPMSMSLSRDGDRLSAASPKREEYVVRPGSAKAAFVDRDDKKDDEDDFTLQYEDRASDLMDAGAMQNQWDSPKTAKSSSRPSSSYKLDAKEDSTHITQELLVGMETQDIESSDEGGDVSALEHQLLGEAEPTLAYLTSADYLHEDEDRIEVIPTAVQPGEEEEQQWLEQEQHLEALLADTKAFLSNSRPGSAYREPVMEPSRVASSRPSTAPIEQQRPLTAVDQPPPVPVSAFSNPISEVAEARLKTPSAMESKEDAGMFPAAMESASPVKGRQMPEKKHDFEDPFMTKSVMHNLLASTESEEDFLSYAQRAYQLIRNKAVDEAVDALGQSTATMMSMEASGTYHVDAVEPHPTLQSSQEALPPLDEISAVEEDDDAVEPGPTTNSVSRESSLPVTLPPVENDIPISRPATSTYRESSVSVLEDISTVDRPPTSRPTSGIASVAIPQDIPSAQDVSTVNISTSDNVSVLSRPATSMGISRPSSAIAHEAPSSKSDSKTFEDDNGRSSWMHKQDSRPSTSQTASRPATAKAESVFDSKDYFSNEEKRGEDKTPSFHHRPSSAAKEAFPVAEEQLRRQHADLEEHLGITSDNDDDEHSQVTARVNEDRLKSTLRIQTNIVEMPATPGMSTLGTDGTRPNTRETLSSRPPTSQSTVTSNTLAEAQWIKQQVILDQLRAAQSSVEVDAVQAKLRRNQRRLRIGHQALLMLQQNGLYDNVGSALTLQADRPKSKESITRPPMLLPEVSKQVTAMPAAVPSPQLFSRNPSTAPSSNNTPTPTSQHHFFPPQIPTEHTSSNKSMSGIPEPKVRPKVTYQEPGPVQELKRRSPSPPDMTEHRDRKPQLFIPPKEEVVRSGPASSNSHKSALLGGLAWQIETETSGKQKSRPRSPARLNLQQQHSTDPTNTTPSKQPPSRGQQMRQPQAQAQQNTSSNNPNVDVVPVRREPLVLPVADGPAVLEAPSSARSNGAPVQPPRSSSSGRSRSAGRSRDVGSKLSNFQQAKNAISYVCLAGGHQEERRLEVLALLDYYHSSTKNPHANPVISAECVLIEELKGQVSQFVLMFHKSKSLAFKAIYVLDPSSKSLIRVFGKGPPTLTETDAQIREYMKFETSSKAFKDLPVKSVSSTVDAIILEPPKQRPPL